MKEQIVLVVISGDGQPETTLIRQGSAAVYSRDQIVELVLAGTAPAERNGDGYVWEPGPWGAPRNSY